MRLLRAAWPGLVSSCLALTLAAGCGSSEGSNVKGEGSGAANGSGATSNTAASGPDLGIGGSAANGSAGSTSVVGPDCAGDLIEAQRLPLDMYVMLDVSGSMLDATEGDPSMTKWEAVSSALTDFVSDPASDGIGVGLQVFPIEHPDVPASCTNNAQCANFGGCFLKTCAAAAGVPCQADDECVAPGGEDFGPCVEFALCGDGSQALCAASDVGKMCRNPDTNASSGICTALGSSVCVETADCRPATYATPAAAIAPLPGAAAGLVKAIQGAEPAGLTPSGPALKGAIDQASSWAKAHPDHQVVVVLATDGLPTLCDPTDIGAVAALATAGKDLKPSVSTFVIGVFGPDDTDAPGNLNQIAAAGGTTKAFLVDTQGDVQQQFRDALNKIRAAGLSCELSVPTADPGKTVNYQEVNVHFDDGTMARDLVYVADAAGCDAVDGGWYYDVDPTKATPKRIVTCPATCTAFQKTDMGSVQIRLGCAINRVK